MTPITIETTIHAPIARVWACWTEPQHITQWAFASDTWEAPRAENDLRVGGKFTTVMSAKDRSASFDFEGVYSVVDVHTRIAYDMSDGRHVEVLFQVAPDSVHITETFDPETENSPEMQRAGWQAILDNFRRYVER